MKNNDQRCYRLFFLCLLPLLLFLVATPAHSSDYDTRSIMSKEPRPMVSIDGTEISRGKIIADFLNVAFSGTLWSEKMADGYYFDSILPRDLYEERKPDVRKRYLLWKKPFVEFPHGLPRHNSLTKFEGEISIGLAWPTWTSRGSRGPDGHYLFGWHEGMPFDRYPFIIEHIKKLIPDIEKYTGLPVRFVHPEDPADQTEHFGKIRIIPARRSEMPPPIAHNTMSEYQFWGGVPLASIASKNIKAQYAKEEAKTINGYLLPDEHNRIGMTICKLDSTLDDDTVRGLVTECLLRSLGLPELSEQADSVLGTDAKNGVKPQGFTPYDRFMLSLLYCPDFKPGMDKNAVIYTIMNSMRCMKHAIDLQGKKD